MPLVWAHTHQTLLRSWRGNGELGDSPPMPLILSGWNYTNDVEKAARWLQFVAWATARGLEQLLPTPETDSFYLVEHPTDYNIGPGGGPCFLEWDFTAKARPDDIVLRKALSTLQSNWPAIVGESLALVCSPVRFSGLKARALICTGEPGAEVPWGTWEALSHGHGRRSFTVFRARVNEAIRPLHVDHIHFELSSPSVSGF